MAAMRTFLPSDEAESMTAFNGSVEAGFGNVG